MTHTLSSNSIQVFSVWLKLNKKSSYCKLQEIYCSNFLVAFNRLRKW